MSQENPFATLGIAPTMDGMEVKRAYFRALELHPPHAPGGGFARVRQAYELLQQPGARAAAYFSAPIDLKQLAADFSEDDAKIEEDSRATRAALEEAQVVQRFVQHFSALTWEKLLSSAAAGQRGATGEQCPPGDPNPQEVSLCDASILSI